MTRGLTHESVVEGWEAAFREYFDKCLKPKKPSMKNLDRELCVNFISTLLTQERQKERANIVQIVKNTRQDERENVLEIVNKVIGDRADEFNKTETLLTCAVLVNLKIDLLHLISNEK